MWPNDETVWIVCQRSDCARCTLDMRSKVLEISLGGVSVCIGNGVNVGTGIGVGSGVGVLISRTRSELDRRRRHGRCEIAAPRRGDVEIGWDQFALGHPARVCLPEF